MLSMPQTSRLITRTCDALPVVPAARRREMLALPPTADTHAGLVEEVRALERVEFAPGPSRRPLVQSGARMAFWNAERCKHLDAAADLLAAQRADVTLLCELDHGMARSGQRHTARELAGRLDSGYAYAVEFLELGLGDAHEREVHAGEENAVGYHGAAILTRGALQRPALIRLETEGAWFDGARGERRVGGRIAVVGTVDLHGVDVTVASVHLESHSDPAHRAGQVSALLEGLEEYGPGAPAIVGGDFNTFSFGVGDLGDPERFGRMLEADADRLAQPIPHEPLFETLRAAGFEWTACNRMGEPTQRVAAPPPSARGLMKIDWFFTRGLLAEDPEVVPAVDAAGRPLSDHDLLAVTVWPADASHGV